MSTIASRESSIEHYFYDDVDVVDACKLQWKEGIRGHNHDCLTERKEGRDS